MKKLKNQKKKKKRNFKKGGKNWRKNGKRNSWERADGAGCKKEKKSSNSSFYLVLSKEMFS